jgi:hypothetical protein
MIWCPPTPHHCAPAEALAGQAEKDRPMADDNGHNHRYQPEEESPATLLPMLIGGLILIVVSMVLVMIFA